MVAFSVNARSFVPLASHWPAASSTLSPLACASQHVSVLPDRRAPQFSVLAAVLASCSGKRHWARKNVVMCNAAGDITSVPSKEKYKDLVSEGRMITIEESNIRYAGAFVIFLIGIYKYAGMMSSGIFDYNSIAANAWGAWVLFESGRQSI